MPKKTLPPSQQPKTFRTKVFEIILSSGATFLVVGQTREEFLTQLYRALHPHDAGFEAEGPNHTESFPPRLGGFHAYADPFISAQIISVNAEGWQRHASIRADTVVLVLEETEMVLDLSLKVVPVLGGPKSLIPIISPEREGNDEGD